MRICFLVGLCLGLTTVTMSQDAVESPNEFALAEDEGVDQFEDDALDDELLFFEDIPIVVTANRRAQRITMSSVAISVVTADDIYYGGHTSLPEMLQFTPGLDILLTDRNNVALGVRGLHHQFADRSLVLLDGRNATSVLFGGTDFFRLPIFPGDIDRVEVVRGPGGASWGANAFNGVINVISKKPKDVLGLYTYAQVNEFGDMFNHFRWADQEGKWSWRISGGAETRESSEDAIDDDNFASNDASRDWRANAQAVYEVSDRTELDIGAAFIHITRGDFEVGGFPAAGDPRRDESIDVVRLYGKADHEFENGWNGYLQWFTNIEDVERPSFWSYATYESDIESQVDLPVSESQRLSVGGNLRWIHVNAKQRNPTDFLLSETEDEGWAGLFVIDTWNLSEQLVLEGQVRGDWYSETALDWSGRLSVLYALDEGQNHAVRVSAAKAFRAPSHGIRESSSERVPVPSPPLPPGSFGVNVLESDDLENEETYYFEAGYTASLGKGVSVSATGYYQLYDDLIGFDVLPDPLGAGRVFAQLDNIDGGEAFGAELELGYRTDSFSITAWYSHNNFDTDESNQGIRAFEPAKNKAGATARLFLPHGVTGNLSYKYVGRTKNDPGTTLFGAVPESHRLDLSVSKTLVEDRLEVTLGVHDLLDETDQSVTAVGAFTSHKTPGRIVFGQLRFRF